MFTETIRRKSMGEKIMEHHKCTAHFLLRKLNMRMMQKPLRQSKYKRNCEAVDGDGDGDASNMHLVEFDFESKPIFNGFSCI